MKDVRTIVAGALMFGVLSVLATAQAHSAAPEVTHYSCDGLDELAVERTETAARVTLAGRTWELHRKQSGLGLKYASPTAALIIDGSSAVFVADDPLQLRTCGETP